MMQSASPVDAYLCVSLCDQVRSNECACRLSLAVVVHVVEHWAIRVLWKETLDLILEIHFFLHRDIFEAVNIVVCVEQSEVYIADKILVDLNVVHNFVHLVALDE